MAESRPDLPQGLSRELIALRAARELKPGSVVNLGIGLPTLVAGLVDPADGIMFQAENGILGYAGVAAGDYDPDLINAGGQPVDLVAGASFFDTAESFAMIRGGHIDAAVLGGLQVSGGGRSGELVRAVARRRQRGRRDGPGGGRAQVDRGDGAHDAGGRPANRGALRLSAHGGGLRGRDRDRSGGDRRDGGGACACGKSRPA